MNAPRSIDEYLKQLRAALADQDPALIQDALYDAEEYLRAEVAAHPDKSEADVRELIASTYGAPEEVATAYKDTEAKVKAALKTPAPASAAPQASAWKRFFGVFLDFRAYSSLFYMLLTLATGIPYFTAFIGVTRVISLGEGRLLEAVTGERMPRRPMHPGPAAGWLTRIGEMLKDARTWTTLLYLLLMLPLGIVYFTVAVTLLAMGLAFVSTPLVMLSDYFGWWGFDVDDHVRLGGFLVSEHSVVGSIVLFVLGVLLLTLLMHAARAIGRGHVHLAKALLVVPGA